MQLSSLALTLHSDKAIDRSSVSSFGPYFQGALMELVDSEYVDLLHSTAVNPYSQHVRLGGAKGSETPRSGASLHWTINTLDEDAAAHLHAPFLVDAVTQVQLNTPGLTLAVKEVSTPTVLPESHLTNIFYSSTPPNRFRIEFVTPTAFRSQGQYVFWPDPRLVVQSLALKHSALASGDEPDEDLIDEFGRAVHMTSYHLASHPFALAGNR
ncbi:MAG: CRISPR system precrRNA processing endoribonuclease RAMP protein Cas6, partial [Cellulomonadaceae bacterium]|nr:CRISPR system precrRNA processing endoribonuclease RAMP protein Cas6 [Cellulomonadaceae bacterium]